MADSLAAALAELQANPPRIRKRARAQYGAYADLPSVTKALTPELNRLGLLWQTWPDYHKSRFVLRWRLVHLPSGEWLHGCYPIHATDPQKAGSEITYARRYALVTVTGVTPEGDDDDGQAASRQRTPAKIPGPDHERLQPRAEPGDRPAERLRAPVDNDPVDMWTDQPSGEFQPFEPESTPGTMDDGQRRKIFAMFRGQGITDDGVIHGMIADWLDRDTMSIKQLSRLEADLVIKKLKEGVKP